MPLDTGLTPQNVQIALVLYACAFMGMMSAVLLGCELHKGWCLWRAREAVRRSADDHPDRVI